MKPNMKVLYLLSALSVSAAVVQTTSVQVLSAETNTPAAVSTTPVAFVYVSNTPGSGANKVNAYVAAANGKLTPVSGSPFADNLTSMVVNGKYLLGSNIDNWRPDCTLKQNPAPFNSCTVPRRSKSQTSKANN